MLPVCSVVAAWYEHAVNKWMQTQNYGITSLWDTSCAQNASDIRCKDWSNEGMEIWLHALASGSGMTCLPAFELQSKLLPFLQDNQWHTNQAYILLHQMLTATIKTVCWLVCVLCITVFNLIQFWCDFKLLPWCRQEMCSLGLLSCYTVSSCNLLPTFWDNLSVPPSRIKIQEEVQFCLYHRTKIGKWSLIAWQIISYFILFIFSILLFCIICHVSGGDLPCVQYFRKGSHLPLAPWHYMKLNVQIHFATTDE